MVNTCEGAEIVHNQTDCSDKIVIAFTIKEKKLMVRLFFQLVLRFPICIYDIKFLIWPRY